jgi:peptidase S41-like protein
MQHRRRALFATCFTALAFASACSGEDSTAVQPPIISSLEAPLRDLTAEEASDDLEQLFSYVQGLYGPYEYKEARFGYSIEALEASARERLASSPGDDGFYETANWFLSRLQDAHVSLTAGVSSNPVVTYRILVDLQSVEGKALVARLGDPALAEIGIDIGDEVVSIDGVAPHDLLDEISELESLANPVSNQQLVGYAFSRPGFATRLRPSGPTAHVVFGRADGSEYARDLIWRQLERAPVRFVQPPEGLTRLRDDSFLWQSRAELDSGSPEASIFSLGAPQPFFVTSETQAAFGVQPVIPSPETLAALQIDPDALPDIFAGVYEYQGKKILLLRQPTYAPPDIILALRYYVGTLIDFESQVDGLVIDQTHNPGGSVGFVSEFFELFAGDAPRKFVQALNADRSWIDGFRANAADADPTLAGEVARSFLLRAAKVESAYDAGEPLTAPLSLSDDRLLDTIGYVWKKPLLVLIDELAVSGGDAFPLLIRANHVAPLFGQRTMGGGGSVELVAQLPHSHAGLRLTRGLFTASRPNGTYAQTDFVENRGVVPDILHELTVADYRAGFVGYMTHFSEQIVSQINARSPALE